MGGLIFLAVLAIAFSAAIIYGTRAKPNEGPALGTNLGQAGDGMVWWRRRWLGLGNSSVPDAEEAMGPHYDILTVDHELAAMRDRHRRPVHDGGSWMDEPGAFTRAGLVDEGRPDEAIPGDHPSDCQKSVGSP